MAGHEAEGRIFSKEATDRGIALGLVGGIIGLIAGLATLEFGGIGLAATGIIYNRLKKSGSQAKGHGGGGGHH
ncbi:hypothetical protein BH09PAT1_BH09PAT1_5260 [soil metagenome]